MNVLVVEDERNLADAIVQILEDGSYNAEAVYDGRAGLAGATSGLYDAIVLDVMLPGMSGTEIVHEMRRQQVSTPVLMLTAKASLADKVEGLDAGADDYMTKPFEGKELLARVKAVLRRSAPASNEKDTLSFPGLTVSLEKYEVYYQGKPVEMPPKELEVLYYLASHPNMVFTREQLLERVWGFDFFGDSRTVDVHIKRLREKLPDCEKHGWEIHTVWRVGYKFEHKAA